MPARTGAEYLKGLRGRLRKLWYAGQRVKDPTGHPVFARIIRSIAALYDLQLHPELREEMTYPSPTSGERVGLSSLIPKTQEDLVRIRRMMKRWTDFSGGFMGRPPDDLNHALSGFASSAAYFAAKDPRIAENVLRYSEYAGENALCLTHPLIHPQANRSVGPSKQADPDLALALAVPWSRSPDRGAHRHRVVPARPREDRGDRHRPGSHAGLPPDERGGSRAQPVGGAGARLASSDPVRMAGAMFQTYDRKPYVERMRAFLEEAEHLLRSSRKSRELEIERGWNPFRKGGDRMRFARSGWTFLFGVLFVALGMAPVGMGQTREIVVGVVVDITGPASSLGIPERNTVQLYESDFGRVQGQGGTARIRWVVTDGETDVTRTVVAVRRLIEEERAAAIVCCTTSPGTLAIVSTVTTAGVPTISLASARAIVEPVDQRFWVFKTAHDGRMNVDLITAHMQTLKIRRVAFMGTNDAFGQDGDRELDAFAPQRGLEVVAKEYFPYGATDASSQAVRVLTRNPQAAVIWAVPPAANVVVRNLRDLGARLSLYLSQGVANRTFLELGGPTVEGAYVSAGKILVAEQLNVNDPQRTVLLEYVRRYEGRFGPGTRSAFGGHAYDAMLILHQAVGRVVARGLGNADLRQLRRAIRDEIEIGTKNLVGIGGVFNFSPRDHVGLDPRRSMVILQVRRGQWTWVRF